MYDLENEKIVIEVRELINGIDNFKDDVSVYCELMRQMFLSSSGRN